MSDLFNRAIEAIKAERERQDDKFGEQNHPTGMWNLIAAEEWGELARAYLTGDRDQYMKELTQTAAVFVAWLECEIGRESY